MADTNTYVLNQRRHACCGVEMPAVATMDLRAASCNLQDLRTRCLDPAY